jgi:hypothetical protein
MIRRKLILHFELGIGIGIEFGLGLAWIGGDGLGRNEGKGMTPGVYIGFRFLFYLLFSVF